MLVDLFPSPERAFYDAQLAASRATRSATSMDRTTARGHRQHGRAGGAGLPQHRRLRRHGRPTPRSTSRNTGESTPGQVAAAVRADAGRRRRGAPMTPAAPGHCVGPNYVIQKATSPRSGATSRCSPRCRRRSTGSRPAAEPGRHLLHGRDRPAGAGRRQPRRRQEVAGGVLGGRPRLRLPARPRLRLRAGHLPQARLHPGPGREDLLRPGQRDDGRRASRPGGRSTGGTARGRSPRSGTGRQALSSIPGAARTRASRWWTARSGFRTRPSTW